MKKQKNTFIRNGQTVSNFIKITFLFLSFAILLPACKKSSVQMQTVVQGRVLMYGTNDPARTDVQVVLFHTSGGGIFSSSGRVAVDTFQIDANGYYYHEFDWTESGYGLRPIGPDSLYMNSITNYTTNIYKNKQNSQDLIVEPKGWIIVHIKNVPPTDIADWITVSILGTTVLEETFYGPTVDMDVYDKRGNFIFPIKGNEKINVGGLISHYGNRTPYYDSTTFVPALDTILVNFNY